jgi:hypothetical protein
VYLNENKIKLCILKQGYPIINQAQSFYFPYLSFMITNNINTMNTNMTNMTTEATKKLVATLKINNYQVSQSICPKYGDYLIVTGHHIRGLIYNGIVVADNKHCFDKPSKCPLHLQIPLTQQQIDWLMSRLLFWGTKKGFKSSNRYEFEKWDLKYPTWLDIDNLQG